MVLELAVPSFWSRKLPFMAVGATAFSYLLTFRLLLNVQVIDDKGRYTLKTKRIGHGILLALDISYSCRTEAKDQTVGT